MKSQYPLSFSKEIEGKVNDFSDKFIEFQGRVLPKLRSVQAVEWGQFHRRNLTLIIEGSDIKKRADLYCQFGLFSFADLRHLILKLEDLCKHINWIKANSSSRWFFSCFNELVDLENESRLLWKLLIDLNRSESRRHKKLSAN